MNDGDGRRWTNAFRLPSFVFYLGDFMDDFSRVSTIKEQQRFKKRNACASAASIRTRCVPLARTPRAK